MAGWGRACARCSQGSARHTEVPSRGQPGLTSALRRLHPCRLSLNTNTVVSLQGGGDHTVCIPRCHPSSGHPTWDTGRGSPHCLSCTAASTFRGKVRHQIRGKLKQPQSTGAWTRSRKQEQNSSTEAHRPGRRPHQAHSICPVSGPFLWTFCTCPSCLLGRPLWEGGVGSWTQAGTASTAPTPSV